MNINLRFAKLLASIAIVLAVGVVMLGAYTRLTDAGLGCPDWPGCYGKMILPSAHEAARTDAQSLYPEVPIEAGKAWTEMAHRYAAGTLGLLILALATIGLIGPKRLRISPIVAIGLLGLLAFQAALGMWTVTLKLLPVVVMGHLLGGMSIASILVWLRLKWSDLERTKSKAYKPWIVLGFVIVFVQIALGGWVSANYAGLACIGFPQCNQHLWPVLDIKHAFNVLAPIGANYQGGLLDMTARITIQWVHRLGALVTFIYVSFLSIRLFLNYRADASGKLGALVFDLIIIQCVLGIMNVVLMLPLYVAVLHNGVALLLLMSMVGLCYLIDGGQGS